MLAKCNLFRNNPKLAAVPHPLQSSVSLAAFRDFVSALTGNEIEITSHNLPALSQLSQEFGFDDLSRQILEFQPLVVTRLQNALFDDSFVFIANGVAVESSLAEAVALSPAVREQLSVDGCAREFVLNGVETGAVDIRSLQRFGEQLSVAFLIFNRVASWKLNEQPPAKRRRANFPDSERLSDDRMHFEIIKVRIYAHGST
jgi:hypothetical protein